MKVLVVCSGGIDSAAMAARCSKHLDKAEDELILMTFNYGQRGIKEINVVRKLAHFLRAREEVIDIPHLKSIFGKDNQLTGGALVEDLYTPSVVVPLRNGLFLQIAMIYAYVNGCYKVVLGSHLGDITEVDGERLYPDCSPEFFKAFELASDLGTFRSQKVIIESASTLGLNKRDLIKMGYEILDDIVFDTWSCYHSGELHCGICESCRNRIRAFREVGIDDKTKYMDRGN